MIFLNFFYFFNIFLLFTGYLQGLSDLEKKLLINLKEKFSCILREIDNHNSIDTFYRYQDNKGVSGLSSERVYLPSIERLKNLFNPKFDGTQHEWKTFSEDFKNTSKINLVLDCLKKSSIDDYLKFINKMLSHKNEPINEHFINGLVEKISNFLFFLIEFFVNDIENETSDFFEYRFKNFQPEDNLCYLLPKIIKIYEILYSFNILDRSKLIKIPKESFNFVAFHYCASFGDFLFQSKLNDSDSLRNLKHYIEKMGFSQNVSTSIKPFFQATKFICENIPIAPKQVDSELSNCPDIPLTSLEILCPSNSFGALGYNRSSIYLNTSFRNTCKLWKLVRQEALSIKFYEFEFAANLVKSIYSFAQLFSYINILDDIEIFLSDQKEKTGHLISDLQRNMKAFLFSHQQEYKLSELTEFKGVVLAKVKELKGKVDDKYANTEDFNSIAYLNFAKRSLWGMERDLSDDNCITNEESAYVCGAIASSIGLAGLLLRRGYTTFLNIRNINKKKTGQNLRPTQQNNSQTYHAKPFNPFLK